MSDIKKINIAKLLAGMMVIFSSLMVFQIKGQTVFLLLQILLCGFMFIATRKVAIQNNFILIFIVVQLMISMVFAVFSNMPISYKKGAIYMSLLHVVIFFAASYVIYLMKNQYINIRFIKNCIKVMCVLQLHWTIIQYVLFTMFQFDINKFVFVDMLGMVETASAYKIGNYFMPSGFCWHPAVLVPIVVISFFLFDSWYIKLVAVLVSFLCRNTTALICMILCIGLVLARQAIIILHKRRFNRIMGLCCIVVVVVGLIVAYRLGIIENILEKVQNIYERIFGLVNDHGSADAHKRYYTALFDVLNISSIPQILFGYGMGCSGYPFTVLFNQYSSHASWAVESDFMNILYSRGIIGFVGYYGMLAYIAIKGFKVNYKYTFVTLIIAVGGITYNVQFDWMFMINILLLYFVNKGYDLFDNDKRDEECRTG